MLISVFKMMLKMCSKLNFLTLITTYIENMWLWICTNHTK